MKISYITSMFPCWSETFILNEISEHYSSGVDLSIYSIKHCSERLVHEEAKKFIDVTIHPYCIVSLANIFAHLILLSKNPFTYVKVLARLLTLKSKDAQVKIKAIILFALAPKFIIHAKKNGIEHFHAHFATYPAILAWIIASFTNKTFTVTAHAHDIYVNQDLLPIICEKASLIFAISDYNKLFICEKIGKGYSNKIMKLHCGINLKRFLYQGRSRSSDEKKENLVRILSIGRLTGIKGYPYLLEALHILNNQGFNFICNIIGDGPLEKQLKKQVSQLGIEKKVNFLGSKKNEEIPRYFRLSDIFVLACAKDDKEGQDGIPVVFMEAMAYGIPVIGTEISGIPELIKNNKTGLCVDAMNAESLVDAILYICQNPTQTECMRVNARRLIETEFDIANIANKQRLLFEDIISK